MGFMESMIAMMAVITVLSCFLCMVATTATVISDPTDSLDPEMFTGEVTDGVFIPHYEEYCLNRIDSQGLEGIHVRVMVPGIDCENHESTYGVMEGSLNTRMFTTLIPVDNGCTSIAIIEVTVCG